MAYDEQLATRVRALLKGQRAFVEKKDVRRTRLSVERKDVRRHLEAGLGRAGGSRRQRQGVEEAPHETDGFHGTPDERLYLRRPRRNPERRAVAYLAHARAGVRLGSTGGEAKGSPPTRLTSPGQHA